MSTKLLVPLVLVFLALGATTWAASAVPTPVDNPVGPVLDGPAAWSVAWPPAGLTGDSAGTIPMFSVDLNGPRMTVDIAFLAQETVVGPDSVFGAGVMLTFKAASSPAASSQVSAIPTQHRQGVS